MKAKMDELFQTAHETPELIKAEVTGDIPEWVNGTLLRNAPAKFEFGKHAYKHWFDGLALLHAFVLENGVVSYRSKYLRTQAFVKGEEQKRIVYAEFGTAEVPDPCQNIFSRFFSYFTSPPPKRSDNCAVNVFEMKGKVFANNDSPYMAEIDPITLDLLEVVSTARADLKVSGSRMVYTMAHPHEDQDGNVFHVMTSLGSQTTYNFVQVPPAEQGKPKDDEKALEGARILASIPAHNRFSYYHSFGLTPNYFIFVENPFVINTFEVLKMKLTKCSFHQCIHWDKKQPSRFHLINRNSGSCVATFEGQSFFAFHHVNAYEDGDEVVVDICCYPDPSVVDQLYLHNLRSSQPEMVSESFADLEVRRYRLKIPGESKTATHSSRLVYEILGSDLELPRINYRLNGMPYRFVYGTGPHERGHFLNQLVKLDTKLKEKKTWYEPDCYTSEPVFVQRPGAKDEDDGVILSNVVGTRGQKSFLVVLDASSFEELARATIPNRIPVSSHGMFLPSK